MSATDWTLQGRIDGAAYGAWCADAGLDPWFDVPGEHDRAPGVPVRRGCEPKALRDYEQAFAEAVTDVTLHGVDGSVRCRDATEGGVA